MVYELSDSATWVDKYGDLLFRYTLLRVRNKDVAEDIVQESLLGALKGQKQFKGQSSEKAWIMGILKHKIIDYYRTGKREQALSNFVEESEIDQFFDNSGRIKLHDWGKDPLDIMKNKEFWAVLQHCILALPDKTSRVFTMRELDGATTEEISKELDITPTNIWVILHRARLGLRRCLETTWFKEEKE